MTKLPRIVPDTKRCMVMRMMSDKWNKTSEYSEETYLENIEKFERKCEKSLIETLSRLEIKASVKTDPYSLPHQEELVVTLRGESYLNGPYEFYRVARKIAKELLEKNLYALRFYLFINAIEVPGPLGGFGAVEYRFRYYPKN